LPLFHKKFEIKSKQARLPETYQHTKQTMMSHLKLLSMSKNPSLSRARKKKKKIEERKEKRSSAN